jgi:hypothetical protein
VSSFVPLFAGLALVAGGLASLSVWAQRRPAAKLAALALAALLLPLGYLALADLPGRPKPVRDEWLHARAAEAIVLAFDLEEGRAIHLWLRLPGVGEPRAYRLPWSRPLAQQLQDAGRAAEKAGTAVAMRQPFEPSLDDREPKVYPLPQPALPPKEVPGDALVLPPRPAVGPGRGRSVSDPLRLRARPSRRGSASASRSPARPTGATGGPGPSRRGAARP